MERDTIFSVLILLGLMIVGIGYVSFADQILLVPADETIDYLEERSCPEGTHQCSASFPFTSKNWACCRNGEECKKAFNYVVCSPKNKEDCPCDAPVHCTGTNSNACCKEGSTCAVDSGYAVCKSQDSRGNCKPGETKCGEYYCCKGNEECIDDPSPICSARTDRACPAGQEICTGKEWNICCPRGTCSNGGNGQTQPTCNVPACPPKPPECDEEAVYDPDCDRPGIDEENEDILE